ncbi:MAG: aldo/keto reductase [Planctomycetota bacterium]|jgi:hypothetical protein
MRRREFLKRGTLATGILSMSNLELFGENMSTQDKSENRPGFIPKRRYGKTDVMLSVIGFGGIIVMDAEQETANKSVAKAYERGVNYFDVAPAYGDAELKLGPALEPYRKDVRGLWSECEPITSIFTNSMQLPMSKKMWMRHLPKTAL